ncbi:isochorismate synthase [Gordonia sp. PDNC005]|uniref:isochorismate synthase n=1 Tax=unclassified Gordonia (in: high G+C Gram-positive bacteria) TaxID=2657482 RepID=UPI0019650E27|nr:isochorismate synthase [Gordonia sp. PDNC005]QRY61922.1 isochorismate synthase [Gordonia sp. PDNC005]
MTFSSFFSSPTRTLRGSGVSAEFSSVGKAHDALAAGDAVAVTGAFGFDPTGVAALIAPQTFGPAEPFVTVPDGFGRATSTITPADVHADRVRSALAAIDDGRVGKVVLARTLDLRFEDPIDPAAVASRFVPGPNATTTTAFAVPLDAAGRRGHWLIGASPELLVRRSGRVVTCHPFAGTAPRWGDAVADRAAVESLRASDKDLREHAFVVDSLVNALRPLCTELDVPEGPQIQSTPTVWHLATPIRGVLADASTTSLDLAALLSPTPAVCGTPTTSAAELIAEIEGPRDFYAGAVGWCDASGDGQWLVSIRCLELDAAHTGVTTWAGGGIVAGSDPDDEVAETEAKFRTVLSALGLSG